MKYLTEFLEWAQTGANPDTATRTLQEWELVPLHVGDELAALAIVKGTEIHFTAAPKYRKRLIHRQRTRDFLRPLFDRHGFLTTRSDQDDIQSSRFLLRMGFERTWFDGVHQHWMLTALPFGQGD